LRSWATRGNQSGLEPHQVANEEARRIEAVAFDFGGFDKSKYTDKQERKADHIAESFEDRGVSEKEAERRAWATVNKNDGGGQKTGESGQGKHTGHPAAR
jgi:hypothetical protein